MGLLAFCSGVVVMFAGSKTMWARCRMSPEKVGLLKLPRPIEGSSQRRGRVQSTE